MCTALVKESRPIVIHCTTSLFSSPPLPLFPFPPSLLVSFPPPFFPFPLSLPHLLPPSVVTLQRNVRSLIAERTLWTLKSSRLGGTRLVVDLILLGVVLAGKDKGFSSSFTLDKLHCHSLTGLYCRKTLHLIIIMYWQTAMMSFLNGNSPCTWRHTSLMYKTVHVYMFVCM